VRLSVLEQGNRPDADGRSLELERDIGAPRDGNQPPPIGVAAVDRGLDEQRVRDRFCALFRFPGRGRARDIDGDELGRPLAAARVEES